MTGYNVSSASTINKRNYIILQYCSCFLLSISLDSIHYLHDDIVDRSFKAVYTSNIEQYYTMYPYMTFARLIK